MKRIDLEFHCKGMDLEVPMNDETIDDVFLREFLLGKVNDEERGRIEDLFLIDPQAKERVLGVEQDLIEDYLEGTLTTADRERFVSRYAQTPEQRRRLRILKSIKDWALAEAAASVPAKTSGFWERFRPAFFIPIAATAIIVIVVGAVWLSRRMEHSAIEKELAQLNTPANLRKGPVAFGLSPVAALVLSPVTVRGGESPAFLNTSAFENEVVLRLLWIQKERYPRYQATIRRVDESQLFTVRNLEPESDGSAIHLKLPTHVLTRGTYLINLSADGSENPSEEYQVTAGS
jgi:hypothetical protein